MCGEGNALARICFSNHSSPPFSGCAALLSGCTSRGRTERSMSDNTRVIEHVAEDEHEAAVGLLPLVYEELRKLAAARMADESDTSTLQPTALVHEAWLRLAGTGEPKWK